MALFFVLSLFLRRSPFLLLLLVFLLLFFFSWRRVLVFQAGRAHSSAATGCGWRHRLHFLFEAPRFRIYRMLEETTTTTTTATTTQVVGKDGSPRPPISALYHAK